MSIDPTLKSLVGSGQLHALSPRQRNLRAVRALFLTDAAWKQLNQPGSAIGLLGLAGQVRATLETWVTGRRVGNLYLKPLDPPPTGIWEIRCTAPVIQVRVFGFFYAQDVFVATSMKTRTLLGNKGSKEWEQSLKDCSNSQESLLPNSERVLGKNINDYVSENADPIKIPAGWQST